MSTLAIAIAITAEGFKYKTDKAGEPYILHCLRVMNNLHSNDKELKSIAILHDTVEDGVVTIDELIKLGFSHRIVTAVNHLTHDKRVPYQDYIRALSHNEDARLVKIADLKDNSDITRLKGLTKADFERITQYHIAYTYLSKV